MDDRSYVDVLLKQGVTGGRGFEVRVKLCKGDKREEIEELGRQAKEIAEGVFK